MKFCSNRIVLGVVTSLLHACSTTTPLIDEATNNASYKVSTGVNKSSTTESAHRDPVTVNAQFPPTVVELNFKSREQRLNGHIYLANGSGPHPTVNLAQAMRRVGFNVLFFHYRGAWGSEGLFSYDHVIDDVASAINMLRDRHLALRVDQNRLILVGHSLGGFAALHGAAQDPAVRCVAGLAAADIGARAVRYVSNPESTRGSIAYGDNLQMLAGWSGQQAVDQIIARGEAYSLTGLAQRLRGKSVLLIAADKDSAVPIKDNHTPMVQAYKTVNGIDLTDLVLTGDHSFSWSRVALIDTVVAWAQECR